MLNSWHLGIEFFWFDISGCDQWWHLCLQCEELGCFAENVNDIAKLNWLELMGFQWDQMEGVFAGPHFKTVRIMQFVLLVRAAPSWYCWCHCDYCSILCFFTKHCDSEHVWQNNYMKHYEHSQRDFILPCCRYDWWRWRVESGARGWYQEGLCRQTSLDWSGHWQCSLEDIWKTLSLKVTVVVTMCAHEMKMHGAPKHWTRYFNNMESSTSTATWKTSHWSRCTVRVNEFLLWWSLAWNNGKWFVARCGNSPWKRWPTENPCMCFSIALEASSQRWRSVCLACRGLQLFCPGCHPVAAGEATFLATLEQSPVCLGGFVEIGRLARWVAKGS